jgi:helicase SWR1
MDRQCQDRCHRIGQTRDVHIYRLVCTNTIEENMLKKANQKRRLEGVIISEGDFTTEYFSKTDWRDMLEDDADAPRRPTNPLEGEEQETAEQRRHFDKEMRAALMDAEDEVDQQAAQEAEGELVLDDDDFEDEPEGKGNGGEDELDGTVDKWMLVFLDRDENEDLFEDL